VTFFPELSHLKAAADLHSADRKALERMHAVRPVWRGVTIARDVVDFPDRTILHAGPPTRRGAIAQPLANSAVMSILFEGWAKDAAAAAAMLGTGAVQLRPAQEHRAMVPLAAVLSPNMAVQVVADAQNPDNAVFSPLNGGTAFAQRFGLCGRQILSHLRWINGNLAAALEIIADQEIPLIDIADAALEEGDDCHARTAAATKRLVRIIGPRLGGDTPERRFLDRSSGFFLNLWMAAVKCIATAGEGEGSSIITALGGNGVEVGLKLGGLADRWFVASAEPPSGGLLPGHGKDDRIGAIGDSALVDALGFGAMTSVSLPSDDATSALAVNLLPLRHPTFPRTRIHVGMPARNIVRHAAAPGIVLGILDRSGRVDASAEVSIARRSSCLQRRSHHSIKCNPANVTERPTMNIKTVLAPLLLLTTMSVAQADDTIKIGGLLETSGPIASLGQPGLDGAMLAVEQINGKGGIGGRKLELININTESDNTKTVTAAKRLLEQDGVVALVGPMNSGSSYAIIDTVQRASIAMISNGGSRGIVLPAQERKWIFLAPLTDVLVQSVMMADMMQHGIKNVALLNADSPFGTSGREQLEKNAASFGITIVAQQAYGNDDKDMTPQLTKIRSANPDAVVIWATGPGQAIAVKNYRQLGLSAPLYLSHAANDFNFVRLAGASADDILIPSSKIYVIDALKDSDPQKPVLSSFVKDYQTKYGKPPATFAGNAYDAVNIIAEAIRKAGPDRAKVRDAIEQLRDQVGVTAVYSYGPDDHFGAKADSVVLLTVKDGKFALAR